MLWADWFIEALQASRFQKGARVSTTAFTHSISLLNLNLYHLTPLSKDHLKMAITIVFGEHPPLTIHNNMAIPIEPDRGTLRWYGKINTMTFQPLNANRSVATHNKELFPSNLQISRETRQVAAQAYYGLATPFESTGKDQLIRWLKQMRPSHFDMISAMRVYEQSPISWQKKALTFNFMKNQSCLPQQTML